MSLKIGIKQKLSIIFFLFFLVFSGTVGILLFNVQRMVETTESIVTKNNKIDELSEVLSTSILDMDTNHKKLKVLKKDRYSEYFSNSKDSFEKALEDVMAMSLASGSGPFWRELSHSYKRHRQGFWDTGGVPELGSDWVTDQVVATWVDLISQAQKVNEKEIEEALRRLNKTSSYSARNGLLGFCISVIVGLFGILFLVRSIISPLKTLAQGFKRVSVDKQHKPITLKGGEEFNELAHAFNDMSRQLNEEESIRNEFIATLSHEIRTPLSSIRESVNMIVEEVFGPINDKQRKFLQIASVEIHRINKLLNHLLHVSVLESNVRKKSSTKIDAREIVQSSVELFSSMAEKKNIAVQIQNPSKTVHLYGVREELQQVFINIIGNAVKFSPESTRVSINWKNQKNSFILFSITDSGPGIAENELPLIFTKYYRAKKARGHLDGVGLGLAISKKIVTSYGGEIQVLNNAQGGCTFSFSLPTN